MANKLYLVLSGNSQTHAMTIEGIWDSERDAQQHRLSLLSKNVGRYTGHEYIKVRGTEPQSTPPNDHFQYRAKVTDWADDSEETSNWFDSYSQALDVAGQVSESADAPKVQIQRKDQAGNIQETPENDTPTEEPWGNYWR